MPDSETHDRMAELREAIDRLPRTTTTTIDITITVERGAE